jgi:hypothetical protein
MLFNAYIRIFIFKITLNIFDNADLCIYVKTIMHKTASHSKTQQSSTRPSTPDQDACIEKKDSPIQTTEEGLHRRDFIKRSGLAIAGLATASTLLTTVRRGWSAGTNPTEITFSSAKFFGKETIANVVEAFTARKTKSM